MKTSMSKFAKKRVNSKGTLEKQTNKEFESEQFADLKSNDSKENDKEQF